MSWIPADRGAAIVEAETTDRKTVSVRCEHSRYSENPLTRAQSKKVRTCEGRLPPRRSMKSSHRAQLDDLQSGSG